MECCGDVCYLRILVGKEESNGTNYKGICHATDGPPTTGPAGPSTANFVAIDGPAGLSMAAMDGPAGLSTAP